MRLAPALFSVMTLVSCSVSSPAVSPSAIGSAALASAPPTPSPTTTPAVTASPVPTLASPTFRTPAPITDPAQAIFAPRAWRPTGTTFVVAVTAASGATTLLGIPLDARGAAGPAVEIVNFVPNLWSMRRDGGAVALVVATLAGRTRLLVWDAQTNAARWLLPDEPDTSEFSPVWSDDGSVLYYVAAKNDSSKAGVFEVRADGSGRRLIASPDRFGDIRGLTPDGKGIVWSRSQAGGSVDVIDVATGQNRHLEDVAAIAAWRVRQPRALITVGGCCAGRPGGSLVLWDDVALTSRAVAPRTATGPGYGGAAWDPAGTKVVAVQYEASPPYTSSLVVLLPETGEITPIEGTRDVAKALWPARGIAFVRPAPRPGAPSPGSDLVLLPANGGPAVVLYHSDALVDLALVLEP